MIIHCAQKFKSEVAQQKQKEWRLRANTPPNYANGEINITTRNGKHPFTRTVKQNSCGDVFHICRSLLCICGIEQRKSAKWFAQKK